MIDVGKIELRSNDFFWVATYRLPGDETVELARIRLSLIESNEGLRKEFQALVTKAAGEIIKSASGTYPDWHVEAKGAG